MTKHQRAEAVLRKWQDILGLGHWRLDLTFKTSDALEAERQGNDNRKAVGTADRDYPTLDAEIIVAGEESLAQIESTICHECLHCLATELLDIAWQCANELGKEARRLTYDRLDVAEEHLVQHLERAFERLSGQ